MTGLPAGADVELRVRNALEQARGARRLASAAAEEAYARFESTIEEVVGELLETKGLLEGMLASSTEYSIIGKDLERRIVLWNEGARRNYGYVAAEVLGRKSDFLHAPEDLESGYVDWLHGKALEEGMAEGRFRRRRRDGSIFVASVVLTVRRDRYGKVVGYLLVSRDVTREEQTLRELRETKSLLDNILASSTHYSIIGKDLERRIVLWNEGARRNYGYEAAEVVGQPSDILHDPSDLESGRVAKLHREALENGKAEGEFLRRRKDGSTFPASVVITRRVDADGRPIGYLVVSRDMTVEMEARRAHERALEAEQAREENRFKTRFLNMAAHELGTPLTTMRLQLTTIARQAPPELKGNVEMAWRNGERLIRLTRDILDATRLQANRLEMQRTPMQVHDVVRGAVEAVHTGTVDVQLPGAPVAVLADGPRLRQAFVSLLEDALARTDPGRHASIAVAPHRDGILVTIRDGGRGIAPEDRERVFEPFSHITAPTAGHEGSGLGLYIAKQVIELHGGSLELGEEGHAFQVWLPGGGTT